MTNKIEVVNDTKRANKRLKPIVEMCEKVCRESGWEKAPRQFQLAFKRLDRELTQADEQGKCLREALIIFQQAYEDGASLEKPYHDVYTAVRQVQSQRWERVANKYGSVSHYFDGFGQIKPKYRRSAHKKQPSQEQLYQEQPYPYGVFLIVILVVLLFWWLW